LRTPRRLGTPTMSKKSTIALLLISVIPFLALSLPFFDWIPDDAYISFQYARSLAEGDGLVFNPEERVEGFSNLLWTLALALAERLGLAIERTARVSSYVAALISVAAFVLLLARAYPLSASGDRRHTGPVVASIVFMFGSFFPLAFYASSGLETAPYVLCLIAGAAFHLWAARSGLDFLHYVSLGAFLGGALLRPEGIGFLLVTAGFLLARIRRSPGRVLVGVIVAFFAYLTALSARFEYYGSVVPNTFFAKPSASLHYLSPISAGLLYLARFLGKSGAVFLIPFAVVLPHDRRKRYAWFYLWALAAYQLLFIIVTGGDVLRFDRFAVPLVPWIFALAAIGFLGHAEGSDRRARRFARRAALACAACLAILNAAQATRAHGRYCFHDWMHSRVHRAVGVLLGDLVPPGGEIVVNEIGAIRYYSHRPVIDMLGLTDETIAGIRYRSFQTHGDGASPWSAAAVARYLLDRNPACIVVPSYEELSLDDRARYESSMHPLWYAIFSATELEERYRPVGSVTIHDAKFLYVFLRNDISMVRDRFELPEGPCIEARAIAR
jgi:hypothetical protein